VLGDFDFLLTNVCIAVNNGSMSRVFHFILAHVCCLLIALPIGWCCCLPTANAEESVAKPTCCCCGDQETPTPSKPAPTPKTPPCCCQETIAALSTSWQEGGPDAIPFAFLPADFDDWREEFSAFAHEPSLPSWLDTSPPLQILYCTWLC
jgi:hypothetical protein